MLGADNVRVFFYLAPCDMRKQMAIIEAAAVEAVGPGEAFDSLTCCMENGVTARQAVAEWQKTG